MHSKVLNIYVICQDDNVFEAISDCQPCQDFTNYYFKADKFNEEVANNADIIVFDLKSKGIESNITKIYSICKKGVSLILYDDIKQIEMLHPITLEEFSDVWVHPLSKTIIKIKFKHILELIKFRHYCHVNELFLDTLIDSMSDLVWFKDVDGRHLKVNNSFAEFVNKPKDCIKGQMQAKIFDIPDDIAEEETYLCQESDNQAMNSSQTIKCEEVVSTANGLRQFKTHKTRLFDIESGQILGTVGFSRDITDYRNMGLELELFVDNVPLGILICDNNDRIININKNFAQLFDVNKTDMVDNLYSEWIKDLEVYKLQIEDLKNRQLYRSTIGRVIEVNIRPILDIFENVIGQLILFEDVTTEITYEIELNKKANIDYLTNLYNRSYFFDKINKLDPNQDINVVYMDLDNFKLVNDHLGHLTGDMVLIKLGMALQKHFGDCWASRIGGDEFTFITTDGRDTLDLLQQIYEFQNDMNASIDDSIKDMGLAVSVGVASNYLDKSLDIDQLMSRADIALYFTKENDKGDCNLYDAKMEETIQHPLHYKANHQD